MKASGAMAQSARKVASLEAKFAALKAELSALEDDIFRTKATYQRDKQDMRAGRDLGAKYFPDECSGV